MKTLEKLSGTLVYVQIVDPSNCFEKAKGSEWKVGIVVDEDTADEFEAVYPKQAGKKVKTADFESIYKCKPPENAEKNVWVITLKKNTKLANGEEVPDVYKPKAFLQSKDADGKVTRKDITLTQLVGNGSLGAVSIDHWESPTYGGVARLKNVLVTDLIEYVRTSREAGSEFDDEKAPEPPESLNKTKEGKAPKAAAKQKADATEDTDPF